AGNVVKAYHILGNAFTDGTSVDIASGAGSTGPLSGREIKNNHFDLNDNGFNGISFNGTVAAIPWFANPVGGAQISGNTFATRTQSTRWRGPVQVPSEFHWKDWFNDNPFEGAVMAGPDPENGVVTAYAYDCGYGANSCPNTTRIAGTINAGLLNAAVNDTVLV